MNKGLFKVACFQLNSSSNIKKNILQIDKLFQESSKEKIDLTCLPECSGIFSDFESLITDFCSGSKKNYFLNFLKECSKKYNTYIVIGSIPVKKKNNKFFNRSIILNNQGEIIITYDKINLFDVVINNRESYKESTLYDPGDKIKTCQLPWGKIGLSICYDLRFPLLYRKLAKRNIKFISIPAAFTETTGKYHWHPLLKARAIENGCYVFAAAQCGIHDNGRKTYGHSLIINPWGEVLAEGSSNKVSYISSVIDVNQVDEVKSKIPATTNFKNLSS